MRFHSTPESAERGEVTVLAIVETIVAMGASLLLAVYLGSVRHIAIGGVAVLFTLFRTPLSVEMGLRAFHWDGPAAKAWLLAVYGLFLLEPLSRMPRWISIPIGVPVFFVGGLGLATLIGIIVLVTRVVVTAICVVLSPITSLAAASINWKRIVLCTDTYHPPEPLPGVEIVGYKSLQMRGMAEAIRKTTAADGAVATLYKWCVISILFIVLYLPAFFFRIALKSTCLIHLPFLWRIRTHFGETLSAAEVLEDIRGGESERLQRWYGVIIAFVIFGSILWTIAAAEYPDVLERIPQQVAEPLREAFVPVEGREITFEAWHIARMLNVGIAFWLYLYADKASRRLRSGRWSEQQILSRVSVFRAFLTVLSAYTIYCSLAIFLYHGLDVHLPPMGVRFFPEWE